MSEEQIIIEEAPLYDPVETVELSQLERAEIERKVILDDIASLNKEYYTSEDPDHMAEINIRLKDLDRDLSVLDKNIAILKSTKYEVSPHKKPLPALRGSKPTLWNILNIFTWGRGWVMTFIGLIVAAIIAAAVAVSALFAWLLIPAIGGAIWMSSRDVWVGFNDLKTPDEFEKFIRTYQHTLINPPVIVGADGKRTKMKPCDIWGVNRDRMMIKGLELYNVDTQDDLLLLSPGLRYLESKCKRYELGWDATLAERVKLAKVRGKKRPRYKKTIKKLKRKFKRKKKSKK